jgi:16S rRNA (guanine966-N2)-methyltransferase
MRGKRLVPVPGDRIRPSSDRLRESIFNILGQRVANAQVLDLYAGTGSFGIEALSRGANTAVFIDNHPQSIDILTRNIKACSLEERGIIIKRDILQGLAFLKKYRQRFHLVFLDPPYDKGMIAPTLRMLDQTAFVQKEAVIVVEHSANELLPKKGMHIQHTDKRRYGRGLVSFYEYML